MVMARRPPTCMPGSVSISPGSSRALVDGEDLRAPDVHVLSSTVPSSAAGGDELEGRRLPELERGAVTLDEVLDDRLGDDLGRAGDVLGGRLVRRVGGRQHGAHVDDERQRVAGLDDVALRLVAVGQLAGDVELQLLTGLGADEALLPAVDDAAVAERRPGAASRRSWCRTGCRPRCARRRS